MAVCLPEDLISKSFGTGNLEGAAVSQRITSLQRLPRLIRRTSRFDSRATLGIGGLGFRV